MITKLTAALTGPYRHATGLDQALTIDNGYGDVSYFSADANDGAEMTTGDASRVRLIEKRPDGWLDTPAQQLGEAGDDAS